MSAAALLLGILGLLALPWPVYGKFGAIACGILAVALGFPAFRSKHATPRYRLGAATGVTLGAIALMLGTLKVALTLAGLYQLRHLLGGS